MKWRAALCFGPGFRGDVFDLPVGQVREAGEDVPQVGMGIEAAAAAAFDEAVKDGSALAGFGVADEEPVLLADGGGTDGVFDPVVVDFDAPVFEVDAQRGPLAERVVDGLAQETLGQVAAAPPEREQRPMKTGHDGPALLRAGGAAQAWPGALSTQVFFDAVEVRDLAEDPARGARRRGEGFMELAPGVRPAAGEHDLARTSPGKGGVGAVAIALQSAGKVGGDDVVQTGGGAAGLPVKEHVAAGAAVSPEVALSGFAVAWIKIADGRFIDLDITASHDSGAHGLVDRPQPVGGETDPAGHALPGKFDAVAGAITGDGVDASNPISSDTSKTPTSYAKEKGSFTSKQVQLMQFYATQNDLNGSHYSRKLEDNGLFTETWTNQNRNTQSIFGRKRFASGEFQGQSK